MAFFALQDCKFSDWHEWQSVPLGGPALFVGIGVEEVRCVNDQKVRFRVNEHPARNGLAAESGLKAFT